jgi:hypothetical protein
MSFLHPLTACFHNADQHDKWPQLRLDFVHRLCYASRVCAQASVVLHQVHCVPVKDMKRVPTWVLLHCR